MGDHVRTDARRKTLFIASDLSQGIGYATNLPVEVYEIDSSEFRPEDRVMNGCHSGFDPNMGFGHFVDQRALHIKYGTYPKAFGVCVADRSCGSFCCPYHNIRISVDYPKITEYVRRVVWGSSEDYEADRAIRKTIAHEIGHAVGMCWGPYLHDVPEENGKTTYMVSSYPWLVKRGIKFPDGYGDHNLKLVNLICVQDK
jgi:hypothetical protein